MADEAIVLEEQISRISEPPKAYFDTYKDFIASKPRDIKLRGTDLKDTLPSDYVLTYSDQDADRLSRFVRKSISRHLRCLRVSFQECAHVPIQSTIYYSDIPAWL